MPQKDSLLVTSMGSCTSATCSSRLWHRYRTCAAAQTIPQGPLSKVNGHVHSLYTCFVSIIGLCCPCRIIQSEFLFLFSHRMGNYLRYDLCYLKDSLLQTSSLVIFVTDAFNYVCEQLVPVGQLHCCIFFQGTSSNTGCVEILLEKPH